MLIANIFAVQRNLARKNENLLLASSDAKIEKRLRVTEHNNLLQSLTYIIVKRFCFTRMFTRVPSFWCRTVEVPKNAAREERVKQCCETMDHL